MTSNALEACPKMIKDEAIFIEIEIYSMLKKIISRGKSRVQQRSFSEKRRCLRQEQTLPLLGDPMLGV